jgi:hypothetical protein
MNLRFDFVVRTERGELVLAVEAKSKLGTDSAWAQEVRARIMGRAPIAGSFPFLLVTLDQTYVWRANAAADSAPVVLDTATLLASHFARIGVTQGRSIDAKLFEDLVHWWLQDLATGVQEPPIDPAFDPVARALKAGRLIAEIAA